MAQTQYSRYFLHLILSGSPGLTLPYYELPEDTYNQLSKYVTLTPFTTKNTVDDRLDFLWIETTDGLNLMVSLKEIDLLRIFTRAASTPPPPAPRWQEEFEVDETDQGGGEEPDESIDWGRVEIYLRGHSTPIISSTLDGAEDIAQYFPLMDDPIALETYLEEDGPFIYFLDDDGEEVGIRVSQLIMLVAYPGSVDFDFKEVDEID